jgi:hypothetical protein
MSWFVTNLNEATNLAHAAVGRAIKEDDLEPSNSLPFLLARIRAHARACEAFLEQGETEVAWYGALGQLTRMTAICLFAMAVHGWEKLE